MVCKYLRQFFKIIFDVFRGGCRTAATSKMEGLVIIVNDFQPLTIITKRSILDVAAALDPLLLLLLQLASILSRGKGSDLFY